MEGAGCRPVSRLVEPLTPVSRGAVVAGRGVGLGKLIVIVKGLGMRSSSRNTIRVTGDEWPWRWPAGGCWVASERLSMAFLMLVRWLGWGATGFERNAPLSLEILPLFMRRRNGIPFARYGVVEQD